MHDFVIVTATFFKPAESRYDLDVALTLTLQTIQEAVKGTLPIIVVDGSPDPEVARTLQRHGAEVIPQADPGFGNAVRQAVAAGARIIEPNGSVHWQEPMKVDLVQHQRHLAYRAREADAAILLPRRDKVAMSETYPREQYLQELLTNLYVEIMSGGKLRYDFTFGPKVFRGPAFPLVARYNGRLWDALVVPVVHAVKAGMKVVEKTVNYRHPEIQCRAEEGKTEWAKKRLTQLNEVTRTIEEAWLTS